MNTSKNINHIGLNPEKASKLAEGLNQLLANMQIYYQNLRGLHWNIKGEHFFQLHTKFEELYTDTQLKIDETAERILTLSARPVHTFEAYLSLNRLRIGKDISEAREAVDLVVENLSALLELERSLLEEAQALSDEGTTAMLSDYIREQEKVSWMLASWLQ
ncbi:Dps family protein [Eisenibacter elegans]|uniref:Dps family protein n=1 Tax=Eisenibacter elegans TaxID=997 RepID=UPI00047BA2DA|nr:Dps family protein [Eisenibacter elegans]